MSPFESPPKVKLPSNALDQKQSERMLIDDFQIAYYETAGANNYLLVEELDEKLATSEGFQAIQEHIRLINELIRTQSDKQQAIQKLFHSIKSMANSIFE